MATPVVVQWQMTVHHSSFSVHHSSFSVHHPSSAVDHPSLIISQFGGSPGSVAIINSILQILDKHDKYDSDIE